jgi:hypothetical protein
LFGSTVESGNPLKDTAFNVRFLSFALRLAFAYDMSQATVLLSFILLIQFISLLQSL